MRPRDRTRALELKATLSAFSANYHLLSGISDERACDCLVEQLLESIRRLQYVQVMLQREVSEQRADPAGDGFDPLLGAMWHLRQGNRDESFWLVFLFVHFGKHRSAGWRYAREVYAGVGSGGIWTWARVSVDTAGFRAWLHDQQGMLRREGVPRGFGNHRKYQSLDAHSQSGTGAAVETYVRWIDPPRAHDELFTDALVASQNVPETAFDLLYQSMNAVASFGRTAKFDYLSMIGKLGLARIKPGKTYMHGATGPSQGARLLLYGKRDSKARVADLETVLTALGSELDVGMQVIEDALCNWQKSPKLFRPFRG